MRENKGFSLIEVIIAMSLFIVIILVTGNTFSMAQRVFNFGAVQNELNQNARVSLDRLSREIRQAQRLMTDISSSTPSNEILFQDGHDLSQISYIRYYLNGTDLMRSRLVYYFPSQNPSTPPSPPTVYVYKDEVDSFGNASLEWVMEDRITSEYFSEFDLYNDEGLITINAVLTKNARNFSIGTQTFLRNY